MFLEVKNKEIRGIDSVNCKKISMVGAFSS